jgi:hypothetical protein
VLAEGVGKVLAMVRVLAEGMVSGLGLGIGVGQGQVVA